MKAVNIYSNVKYCLILRYISQCAVTSWSSEAVVKESCTLDTEQTIKHLRLTQCTVEEKWPPRQLSSSPPCLFSLLSEDVGTWYKNITSQRRIVMHDDDFGMAHNLWTPLARILTWQVPVCQQMHHGSHSCFRPCGVGDRSGIGSSTIVGPRFPLQNIRLGGLFLT